MGGVDYDLFHAVNRFAVHTSWLHGSATFYATKAGPALLAVVVLAAVWWARAHDAATLAKAGWAGLAPLVAVPLNQPLVHAFDRARPFTTHPNVLVLAHRSTDASFPSDHSVLAGSVAAALWLLDRRFAVLATVVGLLLAFSRVYVGAHYPGDVLAGLVVGAAVALAGWFALRRPLTALVERLRQTPLRKVLVA